MQHYPPQYNQLKYHINAICRSTRIDGSTETHLEGKLFNILDMSVATGRRELALAGKRIVQDEGDHPISSNSRSFTGAKQERSRLRPRFHCTRTNFSLTEINKTTLFSLMGISTNTSCVRQEIHCLIIRTML